MRHVFLGGGGGNSSVSDDSLKEQHSTAAGGKLHVVQLDATTHSAAQQQLQQLLDPCRLLVRRQTRKQRWLPVAHVAHAAVRGILWRKLAGALVKCVRRQWAERVGGSER